MTSRILQEDSGLILTQASEPIINNNFIGADSFSTGSPVVQTSAITQVHVIGVTNLILGQPVLSTATITQVHAIGAISITLGQPVISTATITQNYLIGFPSRVLQEDGGLILTEANEVLVDQDSQERNSFSTGIPVVANATLTEGEVNTAVPILTGVPEVNPAEIIYNYSLGARNILTGRPDVEDARDPNVIYEEVTQQMFGGWPKRLYEHTDLAISRGHSTGYRTLYKFGYNPDVNGDEETVWEQGGDYPWPNSAVTMFVSSSSANDTNGGTGANTILIQGLDEDYNEIEETVVLNGQTQVATQLYYLRVYRAFVTLAGSSGTSGGTIYIAASGATSGVPTGTIYANLSLGNQTHIAAYTVPAGHTLYLDEINFTAALSTANKRVNVSFHSRDYGSNVFRTRFINVLQSSQLIQSFKYPQAYYEKTDVECRVSTNTTNNPIAASFQGVIIKNET